MTDPRQSLAMARLAMIIVPCLLTIVALTGTATAKPDHNTVHVDYVDLDLSSARGRAALDARIERALRDVCRTRFSRSVRAAAQMRACLTETRRSIAPQRKAILARAGGKTTAQN